MDQNARKDRFDKLPKLVAAGFEHEWAFIFRDNEPLDQPGHALARSAQRIDVDFKREEHDDNYLDRTQYVRARGLDAQIDPLTDSHSTRARASAT